MARGSGTTRTSVHGLLPDPASPPRLASPRSDPKFFTARRSAIPFCLPRPPSRPACAPRIESTRRPGKKKSATVPVCLMIDILLFHQEKSTTTPSSLSLLPVLSATILSAPGQPNVLCLPLSLSHVLVKKGQFDCTASPPRSYHPLPLAPSRTNKQARIERIQPSSLASETLASKKLSQASSCSSSYITLNQLAFSSSCELPTGEITLL